MRKTVLLSLVALAVALGVKADDLTATNQTKSPPPGASSCEMIRLNGGSIGWGCYDSQGNPSYICTYDYSTCRAVGDPAYCPAAGPEFGCY